MGCCECYAESIELENALPQTNLRDSEYSPTEVVKDSDKGHEHNLNGKVEESEESPKRPVTGGSYDVPVYIMNLPDNSSAFSVESWKVKQN